eukprot:3739987-Pyramimonas_sp.AAC.2
MTVEVWKKVQAKMLPTPAKFHYLFNMRELSRVFQGVVLAVRARFSKEVDASMPFGGKVETPQGYLVGLWRHECERVFCDKLTTMEDKNWTTSLITNQIKENFGDEVYKQTLEPLLFVDFLREPVMDEDTGE